MKLAFTIFCLILALGLTSANEKSATEIIFPNIDSNITWLFEKKPSQDEILKKLGKPQLVKDNIYHYELNQFKYSLILAFNKNKLSSISYRLPEQNEINLMQFKSTIPSELFYHYPKTGHDKGRYYATDLKKEKLKLVFVNNSEKKLQYIIFENQK